MVEGDLRNEEGKGPLAHFTGGMFVSRQPAECDLADRCVEVCDQGRILGQVGHAGLCAPRVHVTQAMELVNDKFHVGVS